MTPAEDRRFAPPPGWIDPRLAPDFEPAHFPLCDGGAAPAVGTDDLRERRKLEFLAAYYEINRAHARLAAAREAERREALLALHAVQTARDAIEDRYTPIGFFGEPQMEGHCAAAVRFMHAPGEPPLTALLFSSEFALAPPVMLPAGASSRTLDTTGFLRFLQQQDRMSGER